MQVSYAQIDFITNHLHVFMVFDYNNDDSMSAL